MTATSRIVALLLTLCCGVATADGAAAAGGAAAAENDRSASPVRHDPFSRPALQPSATPASHLGPAGQAILKGVLTNGTVRLANIDGRIVAAGEQIYGYRVLEIDDRAVTLERGTDLLTLKLTEPDGVELPDGDSD